MSTTDLLRIDAHERRGSALRCALCHDEGQADGFRTCPGCGTVTHGRCVDAARGCPTLGCAERWPQAIPSTTARRPLGVKAFALGSAAGLASIALGLVLAGTSPFRLLDLSLPFLAPLVLAGGIVGHTAAGFDAWRARRGLARPPVLWIVLVNVVLAGAAIVGTLLAAVREAMATSMLF